MESIADGSHKGAESKVDCLREGYNNRIDHLSFIFFKAFFTIACANVFLVSTRLKFEENLFFHHLKLSAS